jgi:hypothetical protein
VTDGQFALVATTVTVVFMAIAMRRPEHRNPHNDHRPPTWHTRRPR